MLSRKVKFEFREGTAAEWTAVNPVLRRGEPGFERDTNQLKIGDGNSAWSALPYLTGGSGGSVASVFGRIGVVVAQTGDYTKTQVGLGNVDNTSDLDKPISTATTTALAGKSNTEHTHGAADVVSGVFAIARLPVGTTSGTVAAGDDSRFSSSVSGNPYPLEGYGFHSASVPIETARTDSNHGNAWGARVWVPAGKAINTIGVFVTQTGTAGTGNNAFAVYDDSGNFVASTPTDNNLWVVASPQWVLRNLSSPIAAQGAGRFVYIVSSRNGGTDPSIAYLNIGFGENMMSGGPSGKYRSLIPSGMGSSFPSTINIATPGSNFGYLPLYVLA